MGISLRSMLIAGVTAAAVSAITVAPVRVTPQERIAPVYTPVHLSAAVTPLTPQEVSSALAEISQIAPKLNLPQAALNLPQAALNLPQAALNLPQAAADVSVQNAASDVVNSVYDFILYWTDYLALDLAPYVLGWVPFGWLITDQIYAIYPPIIQFTDSVVYDLIDPVLNDPLNLEVWVNGISAVAYSAVASLVNVGINEVNLVIDYFLGWLPPLPPLPPWPLSVATETSVLAASELSPELGEVPTAELDVLAPVKAIADNAATVAGAVQTELTSRIDALTNLITEAVKVPATPAVDVPIVEDVPILEDVPVIEDVTAQPAPSDVPAEAPQDVVASLPDAAAEALNGVEQDVEQDTEKDVRGGATEATDGAADTADKTTRKISRGIRDAVATAVGKPRAETEKSTDTKAAEKKSDSADTDKKSDATSSDSKSSDN